MKEYEKLADKKKIIKNGIEYLVDINKTFYWTGDGDYYIYNVFIYNSILKKTIVKKLFTKREKYEYPCIYEYSTYWLKYFNYKGDIDKVIDEAFYYYEWYLKEQKYINNKEQDWKEER